MIAGHIAISQLPSAYVHTCTYWCRRHNEAYFVRTAKSREKVKAVTVLDAATDPRLFRRPEDYQRLDFSMHKLAVEERSCGWVGAVHADRRAGRERERERVREGKGAALVISLERSTLALLSFPERYFLARYALRCQ
jgi:hypothetical protein